MRIKNICITGKRGTGKSTLATQLITAHHLICGGFQTLPYEIEGAVKGHYFHSLVPVNKYENNLPINIRVERGKPLPIGTTFQTLGVECLTNSIYGIHDYLLMDELGRFEENQVEFLQRVIEAFDREKFVLAVVKKEQIAWITPLFLREDVKVLDLDTLPKELAYESLEHEMITYQQFLGRSRV